MTATGSVAEATMLASGDFSHIGPAEIDQSRPARFSQRVGIRFLLLPVYMPLDCVPLSLVAWGTASTE